jgi:UDP-N-acetylmuramyl pentapeptide phosphotransferase/UDP-N-acetylglucosamine-1-phosphate transferase
VNLLAALGAFAVSTLSMFVVIPLLHRAAVLDRPNHRSSHLHVTPRGGGISVLLGIMTGLAIGLAGHRLGFNIALIGLTLVVLVLGAVGLRDDIGRSSTLVRFVIQICLGAVMAIATLQGSHFALPVLIAVGVVGIIWLASYVNAFNFMDGINGISGVSAIAAGLWYASVGARRGDSFITISGLTLAGASLGFLPWNFPRARVFLGDVGSYGIGAMIAFLAWAVAIRYQSLPMALAPVVVYLADTAFTLGLRARRGEPLTEAHRDHVYQRLNRGGLSHTAVSGIVLAFTAAICVCARWLPTPAAVASTVALLCAYVALPLAVERSEFPQ